MTSTLDFFSKLHARVFGVIERLGDTWLLGLIARFAFAAVLWNYFLHSAKTKVGEGLLGFFSISPGAYYQIALPAVEAAEAMSAPCRSFPGACLWSWAPMRNSCCRF
jgi:putative oxidoreductase